MEYKVDIDFNQSAEEWRKNKVDCGNGHFNYRCMSKTKKSLDCKNRPIIHTNKCYLHSK